MTENGDGPQTRQSLDGHSSAQTQHRATITLVFPFCFSQDQLAVISPHWAINIYYYITLKVFFFSLFTVISVKRFLQSTGRPHPSAARPLERPAGHIKVTRPLLIPVAAMQKVNRSMNLINSMNVTSSHYLFMRKIIPFRGYLKWYLKVYPRWFTDRGLVVLLRLHQGFGSVCHSRRMQPGMG